jgi:1-acyl-sn-glycerol-3-phosphate acyltransferase
MHRFFDSEIELFDPTASNEALEHFDTKSGSLLIAHHAGQQGARFIFAMRNIPNFIEIGMTRSIHKEKILVRDNPEAGLFTALKALKQGKNVLIAPDGGYGKCDSSVNILGRNLKIGDGAAFLAYEAGCKTLWYAMNFDGKLFVPSIIPGPVRRSNERYPEFRERLNGFYGERLNAFFTADPHSLVPTAKWLNLFS